MNLSVYRYIKKQSSCAQGLLSEDALRGDPQRRGTQSCNSKLDCSPVPRILINNLKLRTHAYLALFLLLEMKWNFGSNKWRRRLLYTDSQRLLKQRGKILRRTSRSDLKDFSKSQSDFGCRLCRRIRFQKRVDEAVMMSTVQCWWWEDKRQRPEVPAWWRWVLVSMLPCRKCVNVLDWWFFQARYAFKYS